MIAFLDSSALIYLIEGSGPFVEGVRSQLRALSRDDPLLRIAASRLAWLECRTGPIKTGDTELLAVYDAFLSRPDLICVELDAAVIDLATAIRARQGLKTPDALQAASCLQLGPEHVFLSGDAVFRRVPGLNVRLLG